MRVDMVYAARCGFSADLSGPVTDRALFHADNCYFYPSVRARIRALRTNTCSNTAFRGFGGPQGMVGAERLIEEIAFATGLDPLDVRKRNFYGDRRARRHALSPARRGQRHRRNRRKARSDRATIASGARRIRERQCQEPRRQARHRADAGEIRHLVHRDLVQPGRRARACLHGRLDPSEPWRHRDGPGPLHQGRPGGGRRSSSVELERVKITATTTGKVPNTSATAASSGSDLNGMAAQAAARTIKERLVGFLRPRNGASPARG